MKDEGERRKAEGAEAKGGNSARRREVTKGERGKAKPRWRKIRFFLIPSEFPFVYMGGMPREFSLYSQDGGACTVKEEGAEATIPFPDMTEAVTHLWHQKRKNGEIVLTIYDAMGRLTHRQLL